MVRDHVEKDSQAALGRVAMQRGEILFASELRIERDGIDDVVSMRAPLPRFEDRGEIKVTDAEVRKVRDDAPRGGEREPRIQLQAIRRPRHSVHLAEIVASYVQ